MLRTYVDMLLHQLLSSSVDDYCSLGKFTKFKVNIKTTDRHIVMMVMRNFCAALM